MTEAAPPKEMMIPPPQKREQAWEFAKVIGGTILVFGPLAGLLLWFTQVSAQDEQKSHTRSSAALNKPKYEPTEIYLGAFKSMGSVSSDEGQRKGEGVRVVEFEVTGVTRGSNDEIVLFERRLSNYRSRLQSVMNEVARGASQEELNEPEMSGIREKVRGKLNGMFGKDRFEGIVFDNFRMYEI